MLRQLANFGFSPSAKNYILWGALLLLAGTPALANQSVTVTWNPSQNTNVAGYHVYYGGASRVYTNFVTAGNVTSIALSGLSAGATYYFSATALDSSGDESDFSNEATYTVPQVVSNPTLGTSQPPTLDALTNLTVFQNSSRQTIALTGITPGSIAANRLLRVSASSSNPRLVPTPIIHYTSTSRPARHS